VTQPHSWNRPGAKVRILFDPAIFLDSSKGQLFHYCGDWEFLGGNVEMEERTKVP